LFRSAALCIAWATYEVSIGWSSSVIIAVMKRLCGSSPSTDQSIGEDDPFEMVDG
jgi:hypothetical protein